MVRPFLFIEKAGSIIPKISFSKQVVLVYFFLERF